jgi:mxaL protein
MKRWLLFFKCLDREAYGLAAAFALLVAALFIPGIQRPHDTYEYMVVFDITQSMDVEDYELDGAPISRLNYAREATRRAIRGLPCGSRIGWGAFAEYRSLLLLAPVEVCSHYNDLLASLENIDGRMRWANASEVTKGLYWAIRGAKQTDPTPDVIFITDGQEAPPIRPDLPPLIPDDVKDRHIRGWLIGAGGLTPQRIPKTDDEGRRIGYWRPNDVVQTAGAYASGASAYTSEHLSALREPHLLDIANEFGFEYARLTGPDSLAAAIQNPRFARRTPAPVDLYWLPVALAALLLAWRYWPDFLKTPKRGA